MPSIITTSMDRISERNEVKYRKRYKYG
jgi:hypothetical protein